MSDQWYFDCEGPAGDECWIWRRVARDGTVLQESERFKYYLDARNDAERHGFSGTALFGTPEAKSSPA
jgi:hypothetical protein